MNRKQILTHLPLLCFAISLLMFILSLAGSSRVRDFEDVAEQTQAMLIKRMAVMDGLIG